MCEEIVIKKEITTKYINNKSSQTVGGDNIKYSYKRPEDRNISKNRTSILKIINFLFIGLIIITTYTSIVNAAIIQGSIYDLSLEKRTDAIIEIDTIPKQTIVSKTGDYEFYVNNGNYIINAHTKYGSTYENITITNDGNYTIDIILDEFIDIPISLTNNTEDNIKISESTNTPDNNLTIYTLIGIAIIIIMIILVLIYLSRQIQKNLDKKIKEMDTQAKRQEKKIQKEKLELIKKERKILKKKNNIKINNRENKENSADKNNKDNKNNINNINNIDEIKINNNKISTYENKIFDIIKSEKRLTQKELRKSIPLSEAKISLVISDLESQGKIRKIKQGRGNIIIYVKDGVD